MTKTSEIAKADKATKTILTTSDIVAETGWSIQRVQALCRSGQLPAKNISLGTKKARYIVRQQDWEAFLQPDAKVEAPTEKPAKRTRIDSHVSNPVFPNKPR